MEIAPTEIHSTTCWVSSADVCIMLCMVEPHSHIIMILGSHAKRELSENNSIDNAGRWMAGFPECYFHHHDSCWHPTWCWKRLQYEVETSLFSPWSCLFSSNRIWQIPSWMATWPWMPSSMLIRARGSWPTWEGWKSRSCRRWCWRDSISPRCQSPPPDLRMCQQRPPSSPRPITVPLPFPSPGGNPHPLHLSQLRF